jgi:hypothetical protein
MTIFATILARRRRKQQLRGMTIQFLIGEAWQPWCPNLLCQNCSMLGHITDLGGGEVISPSFENFQIPAGPASVFDDFLCTFSWDVRFLTNFSVSLGRYAEFHQIAVSIQMDSAHVLFPKVMHDKQVFGVSLLLISGTGMTWNARNCSCIFEMWAHLLDLIFFFCFVSRLFAFSSFGFVYWVSQSLFCQHKLF